MMNGARCSLSLYLIYGPYLINASQIFTDPHEGLRLTLPYVVYWSTVLEYEYCRATLIGIRGILK